MEHKPLRLQNPWEHREEPSQEKSRVQEQGHIKMPSSYYLLDCALKPRQLGRQNYCTNLYFQAKQVFLPCDYQLQKQRRLKSVRNHSLVSIAKEDFVRCH